MSPIDLCIENIDFRLFSTITLQIPIHRYVNIVRHVTMRKRLQRGNASGFDAVYIAIDDKCDDGLLHVMSAMLCAGETSSDIEIIRHLTRLFHFSYCER